MKSPARKAAYSAAAAASVVAASDAEAVLVYSGEQNISIAQTYSQSIDLNGDSQQDITLRNSVYFGGNYQGATVNFGPGQLVLSNSYFPYYVSALSAGDPINSSTVGPSFFGSLAYEGVNPNAEFQDIDNGYIGFSFPAGADMLFGWVRVSVDNLAGEFTIHDWAYTDDPAGIAAAAVPEAATLGFFAAGAAGLVALRRRRSQADGDDA